MGGRKKKKKKKKSTPQKKTKKKGGSAVKRYQSIPGAPRGLMNLGNTCFFNAVVQNLYRTPSLGKRLIEIRTASTAQSETTPTSPDSNSTTKPTTYADRVSTPPKTRRFKPGALCSSLCSLLEEMKGNESSGYGALRPQGLLTQLRKRAPRFRGRAQQDSQELLRYLLDGVREEEKHRLRLVRKQEEEDDDDDDSTIQTVVDRVFGGFECSVVECTVCYTKSRTRTRFLDISLPIVSPPKKLRTKKSLPIVYPPSSSEDDEEVSTTTTTSSSPQCRKIVRDPPATKTWIQSQNKRGIVLWIHEAAPDVFLEERGLNGRDRLIAKKFKKQELLEFAYELLNISTTAVQEERHSNNVALDSDLEEISAKLKRMDISSSSGVDVVSKERKEDENEIRYIEPDQPQFLVTETTSSIRSCLAAYTSKEILRVSTGDGFACESCSKRMKEWSKRAREAREEGRPIPSDPFQNPSSNDTDDDDGGGWNVVKSKHAVKAEKRELEELLERSSAQDNEEENITVKRDAIRRILLDASALPHVLVLHLKRFSHSKRGRMTKKSTFVRFRERFSVQEFTIRREDTDCKDEDFMYELYGVVVHMGSLNSGHYVAYVRGVEKDQWFYISDSRVEAVSKERVLKSEAYLLFYSRSNNTVAKKK